MTHDEATSLLLKNGWSEQSLPIWLRARGRCEYCQRDLLACEDAHFHGSQIDHIEPHGGDDLENLALSCAACNRIKRNRVFDVGSLRTTRSERIEAATQYIERIRARNKERLAQSVQWLAYCGLNGRGTD